MNTDMVSWKEESFYLLTIYFMDKNKEQERDLKSEAIAKMKELGVDGFSPAMSPEAVLETLSSLENRARAQTERRLRKTKE